jgi:hypothetical protein
LPFRFSSTKAAAAGIEPAIISLTRSCLTVWPHRKKFIEFVLIDHFARYRHANREHSHVPSSLKLGSVMAQGPSPSPRYAISVAEILTIAAIVSTECAIFLPAINAARERQREPPVLPELKALYEDMGLFFIVAVPLVTTTCLAALFALLRRVLPRTVRNRFCWRRPKRPCTPIPLIADSRPAVFTLFMAVGATALLIFVALHVRADRTHRRPVVTWEGPIADYVLHTAVLAWSLSAASIFFGAYALNRYQTKWSSLALLGVVLGFLNYLGSCLFSAAVYED